MHDGLLSQDLQIAGLKAQYDANAKQLLGHKIVISYILAYLVPEFKDMDPKDIVPLIESEPHIDEIGVFPGSGTPKISGQNIENSIANEGKVTYDVRFFVWTPGKKSKIKLLIDLEAQKAIPSYSLTARGIYYGSRMISAQYGTEFINSDYDNIKKSYSIWICMNPRKDDENSTIEYKFSPHIVTGHPVTFGRYDLIDVIIVNLSPDLSDKTEGYEIHHFLEVLFSEHLSPDEKEDIFNRQYGIQTDNEFERRMENMCNLSELIVERGLKEGMEKGMAQGMAQGMAKGRAEGEERINELNERLINANRFDDLKKAVFDKDFRNQLLKEFGL